MDLWSSYELVGEDDRIVQERTGSLRSTPQQRTTRSGRRPSEYTLFRSWLLQDYVPAYCRSLAAMRIFRRCYWIDALGDISVPQVADAAQSPVRKGRKKTVAPALAPIVALSQELAQEPKPITLHGLLLEAGSSKRRRAGHNNAPSGSVSVPKESSVLPTNWLEAASAILKEIEQAPTIFLLNPLGPILFSDEDLTPLYQRAVPTELCLFVPHKQIEARVRAAQSNPTSAQALTALLRSDRWKSLPTDEEELPRVISGFIELLLASMQRHFQFPVQPLTLPVVTGLARIERAPSTILFATRRLDSLLSMNDAVCLQQRRSEALSFRGALSEQWFIVQQRERQQKEWQQLYQRVRQQGQVQRIRRWPDLRQYMLLDHFGAFTQHDYDTIIQQLLLNGEVRCIWRQPASAVETERIPGNDDTLMW
ncbi:MAG TPA: hypothetical protein VKX46_00710 [Ktedonobacteraceae bacterium]|nr:hypothetical protein [Ktedonobacteraceae bacterium]